MFGAWTILGCAFCGLHTTDPEPTPEQYREVYENPAYYVHALERMDGGRRLFQRRVQILSGIRPGHGALLEIGCAQGHFLEMVGEVGWAVTGVEFSDVQRSALPDSLKSRVVPTLDDLPAAACFDVVCAWEVLEHQHNSIAFLEQCAQRVAPGGVLALSTPNIGGMVARGMGRRFPMLIPPEHLSYWSPLAFRQWGKLAGWTPIHQRTFSAVGMREARSGLCKLGLPTLLASLLAPLGVVAFQVADGVGQGSEVEIYLRRSA